MAEQPLEIALSIDAGDDGDLAEVDDLTRRLRRELLDTDVEDAVIASAPGEAPEGSKSGAAIDVGQLLVTVLPAAIPAVVGVVQSWLNRQQNRSTKVKVGGVEMELSRDVSSAEMSELVGLLLAKGGAAEQTGQATGEAPAG